MEQKRMRAEDGYLGRVRGPEIEGIKESDDGVDVIRACETHA